jgi:hypothetical protein
LPLLAPGGALGLSRLNHGDTLPIDGHHQKGGRLLPRLGEALHVKGVEVLGCVREALFQAVDQAFLEFVGEGTAGGKAVVIEEVVQEVRRRDPENRKIHVALTDGERAQQILVDDRLKVTLILLRAR